MVKALADRLAEAFAEWLHDGRGASWYAPGEELSSEELVAERYRGIRPAFGYPACPDHSEKAKLFDAARRRGGRARADGDLRDDCPAASVSGLYFAHPEARYFSVGRIGRDQVEDYAAPQGHRRSPRPSAGCARTSRTSPRPRPVR